MPTIAADNLRAVIHEIASGGGSSADEAGFVADNLVDANLTGHDSHGVGMLPRYIACTRTSELQINAHAELVSDQGAMLVFDGHRGYGQVIGREAMDIGIERARQFGIAIVAVRNTFHLCRIGYWGERCAAAGMVSMHHVNAIGHKGLVAPWGGSDARFTTNPYCAVLPATDANPPTVLDFATSKVAAGKVRVAKNKGERMADGLLIDGEGRPSDDPGVLYRQPYGAILPFGEHKGYGLSLLNELMAGVLSGGGTRRPETDHENDTIINNMLSIIIDPSKLVPPDFFRSETDATIAHVKASPPRNPAEPVLVPGDPERATKAERMANGIPIDDETWRELVEAAASVGIDREALDAIAFRNAG